MSGSESSAGSHIAGGTCLDRFGIRTPRTPAPPLASAPCRNSQRFEDRPGRRAPRDVGPAISFSEISEIHPRRGRPARRTRTARPHTLRRARVAPRAGPGPPFDLGGDHHILGRPQWPVALSTEPESMVNRPSGSSRPSPAVRVRVWPSVPGLAVPVWPSESGRPSGRVGPCHGDTESRQSSWPGRPSLAVRVWPSESGRPSLAVRVWPI